MGFLLLCSNGILIVPRCTSMSDILSRTVIKTKSVEYMPFLLSLFVFLCGTSWFIYGLLGNDPFVAVPNGFGCGLGAVQLILYAIYRDKKGETKEENANGSLEMGLGKPELEKQSDVQPSHNGHV